MKTKRTESRVGLQAVDIFSSTTRVQPAAQSEKIESKKKINMPTKTEQAMPVRTKQHDVTVKSTVTLGNNQIVWLDRLSSDIRAASKSVVDRSAIIRAIILAIEQSKIDLCGASSEDQIRELVCAKLKD